MRTLKLLLCLAGTTIAPVAVAGEISHTAYTWFCQAERRAHGICRSSHTDCGKDCVTLNKVCSIDRNGRLMREDRDTIRDVGTNGSFEGIVHVPLYGTGTIRYCTRNKSKYANWLGTEPFFQGTSTNCREYSRAVFKGEEEN